MDVAEVERRIAEITAGEGDDEAQHSLEDQLHQDVLSAIATGAVPDEKCAEVARVALTTQAISFARWYA